MKDVRVNKLLLENFKGISSFELVLDGKNVDIYGDNATGKTTVYDALTWLLFGKDSHGASKFEVKPLGTDGVARRGAMPTVEAELISDGTTIVLKKMLREKWERHRGGEERYGGNTVDYFINQVPVKEREYKSMVDSIVNEPTFRMLTNAYRFLRDLSWKERRSVLFDVAGIGSDMDILDRFPTLKSEAGSHSIDEFKAIISKQRKDANGTLNLLPARIDECERQLAVLPNSFDCSERDRLETAIAAKLTELSAIDAGEGIAQLESQIQNLEFNRDKISLENEAHRKSQDIPVVDERIAFRQDIKSAKAELEAVEQHKASLSMNIMRIDRQIEEARAEWLRLNKSRFVDGVCRSCGQPLPEDQNKRLRNEFETDKAEKMQKLVVQSNQDKQDRQRDMQEIARLDEQINRLNIKISQLQSVLDKMTEPEKPIIEDLPYFKEQYDKLTANITELNAEKSRLLQNTYEIRAEKQAQIEELRRLKRAEDEKAALVSQRSEIDKRISELYEEQRAKAKFVDRMDDLLDMCEEFTRAKVDCISGAVNELFSTVRFRLYTENINGGLTDCCDAMVDGVPYDNLNSAMKINAGLDIISALSAWYGVKVPLFVDNAESVTQLKNTDNQVIRLIVSANDKKLRCELCH